MQQQTVCEEISRPEYFTYIIGGIYGALIVLREENRYTDEGWNEKKIPMRKQNWLSLDGQQKQKDTKKEEIVDLQRN